MAGRFYRSPGIYQQRRSPQERRIALGESGIPGFLGLARRGPMDDPVRLTSYDDFRREFGAPVEHSYLNDAVYGFFANGGKECFVVRVAHRLGEPAEVAKRASYTALDKQGRPSLVIEAANEGTWGNDISVEIKVPDAGVQTYLTFDLEEGQTRAIVRSSRGFERGTLVRIYDGTKEHYAVLSDVESKVLRWRPEYAVPFEFKSSDLTYVEPVEFDVFLRHGGRREAFRSLSLAYGSERHPERVTGRGSDLIRVTVLEAEGPLADRIPVAVGPVQLSGGQDGLDRVTPADFVGANEGPGHRWGLGAYEANEDIDLLLAPDVMACAQWREGFSGRRDMVIVQEALLAQCEKLRNRFAILDMPPEQDLNKALAWRLRYDSHFGAFYYPWVVVETEQGRHQVPPSGHVAGVYARSDNEAGPHRPPANEVVQGIVDLADSLDEEDIGYLNAHGINPIRFVPARGLRIWGARTVSSRPQWRYVNVRRIMNLIRRAIYQGTQWVVFEPNRPNLWRTVEGMVKYFLQGLYERGFFAGESPEDAFYVKCDAETNSPERRDAGELVAEIGVAPVRPAEFIVFELQQHLPEGG